MLIEALLAGATQVSLAYGRQIWVYRDDHGVIRFRFAAKKGCRHLGIVIGDLFFPFE